MIYDLFLNLENRGDQAYAICPFHRENTPSFTVNTDTGQWYCHGCQHGGGPQRFIELYFDVNPIVAKHIVDTYNQTGVIDLPTQALIQRYITSWSKQEVVQEEMFKWGWTDLNVLSHLKIGWDTVYKRITIPIYSHGCIAAPRPWVNIRKYMPVHLRSQRQGGQGRKQVKCLNMKGLGQNRYWPLEAFDQPKEVPIYIVEGEKDCISMRCQGFNAVTALAGGSIPMSELSLFSERQVILMLDNDDVGINSTAAYLRGFRVLLEQQQPQSIQIIEIPKELGKDYADCYYNSNGKIQITDLSDPMQPDTWLSRHSIAAVPKEHYGGERASEALGSAVSTRAISTSKETQPQQISFESTEISTPTLEDISDEEIPTVTVVQAEYNDFLNKWVHLDNLSITGTENGIYTVPRCLYAQCNGSACRNMCDLADGKVHRIDVPVRQYLNFMQSADSAQIAFVKTLYGCRNVMVTKRDEDCVNIQHLTFQESASFVQGLDDSSFEPRNAIYVYDNVRLEPTAKYNIEACRVTHPNTQKNYYVIRKAEPANSLDTELIGLNETQVFGWFKQRASSMPNMLSLLQQYYDLWLPKIAIEKRLDLFSTILLTYLSVTEIRWNNGILKGWLDTMVIGDTRTGKSQMAQRFVKALNAGAYINGENARKTGVIGGVLQIGKMWLISWGAIPLNDRGLLIIDEASGLTVEDIKELSSTRSSGAVTINKVTKGEARARTRLLWMSNPRSGKTLSEYFYQGWGAFQEFIPSTEDQARFDLVISAAREDVQLVQGQYETTSDEQIELPYWRYLINTAWNIDAEHIEFEPNFNQCLAKSIRELSDKYEGGPLIIGVSLHEKLLRLSCSTAVLCGSFVRKPGTEGVYADPPLWLSVTCKHLEWAIEFLEYTLHIESLNYLDYVRDTRRSNIQQSENIKYVRGLVATYPVLKNLLGSSSFRCMQLSELLGMSREETAVILSKLVERGLLKIYPNGNYTSTKNLNAIIRQMEVR